MVYKFLLSLCYEEEMAEELTQETFYQAVRTSKKYDGSCKVSTWLCQIAKHLWYWEMERRSKRGTRKRIVIAVFAVLLTVGILGTLYESLYGTGTQASAEDVKIACSKIGDFVTIEFLPTDDSYYIEIWGGAYSTDENGKETYEWNKIQPVKWRTKPFETRNKTGDIGDFNSLMRIPLWIKMGRRFS